MPRIEALMASAELEPLLDKLASYMADEADKADFLMDREALASIVCMAGMAYDGTQFSADEASKSTFHEFKELLPRIMELLKHNANYSDALIAFGAPATLAVSADQEAVKRAVERHETILRGLDAIARAAPPPPPKRGRGKPPKTKDLRFMVGWLADRWQAHTGQFPTQMWVEGKPDTNAAKFIYDVVAFIDHERLGELRTVIKDTVADFRAGRRDSWWRDVAEDRSLTIPIATFRK